MISSPAALFARTRPELASPDIKCSISPFSADRPQDGLHPWSGFTMIAYQLRPESRGEIKLKSADPADAAGGPSELSGDRDRPAHDRRRAEAVPADPGAPRDCSSFIEAEFQPGPGGARATRSCWIMPGSAAAPSITRPAPARWASTRWRWSIPSCGCTASTGLRVADASIMPTVVSGNTNAATIMIGERVADLLRQEMRMATVHLDRRPPAGMPARRRRSFFLRLEAGAALQAVDCPGRHRG